MKQFGDRERQTPLAALIDDHLSLLLLAATGLTEPDRPELFSISLLMARKRLVAAWFLPTARFARTANTSDKAAFIASVLARWTCILCLPMSHSQSSQSAAYR